MSCYFEKQGYYIGYFGQAWGTDSHTWSKDNSNQRMVGSSFGCGFLLFNRFTLWLRGSETSAIHPYFICVSKLLVSRSKVPTKLMHSNEVLSTIVAFRNLINQLCILLLHLAQGRN
jgi:hypothetical protein